jgi:aspartyl-tRNA(Asn)/glutamyl-tRNA(Gln) amidotransferase subunit A
MKAMRFANPENLTGLPATSVPVGYDQRGLPVGLQLMADPWEENVLFRLAYTTDGMVKRRRPKVCSDPLPELGET